MPCRRNARLCASYRGFMFVKKSRRSNPHCFLALVRLVPLEKSFMCPFFLVKTWNLAKLVGLRLRVKGI